MRILHIPFQYRAEWVKPRGRKPATVKIETETPVAIRELSEDEFPTAMIYSKYSYKEEDRKVEDIRWDGSSLFRPYQYSEYSKQGTLNLWLDPAIVQQNLEQGKPSPFADLQNTSSDWSAPLAKMGELAGGRIIQDDETQRVLKIREMANNTVICGDKIYVATSEPFLELKSGGRDWWFDLQWYQSDRSRGNCCRVSHAEEFADFLFEGRVDIGKLDNFEVLMPQAFKKTFAAQKFLSDVQVDLESCKGSLANCSVEEFKVFANLRDCFADNNSLDSDGLQELRGAVTSFLSCSKWNQSYGRELTRSMKWMDLEKTWGTGSILEEENSFKM